MATLHSPGRARLRRGAVLGAAIVAGAVLAGCSGGSSGASAGSTASATTPATTTTASATTAAPGGATASTPAAPGGGSGSATSTAALPPHCSAAQLRFDAAGSQGAAGTINVGIKVTNLGPATCWTYGYVGLQILDAQGSAIPTATLRGADSPYQGPLSPEQRNVPHRVQLAPGGWGWFNLAYSDVPTSGVCPVGPLPGAKLAIIAPDTTTPRTIALSTQACAGRLGISPILPASTWAY